MASAERARITIFHWCFEGCFVAVNEIRCRRLLVGGP